MLPIGLLAKGLFARCVALMAYCLGDVAGIVIQWMAMAMDTGADVFEVMYAMWQRALTDFVHWRTPSRVVTFVRNGIHAARIGFMNRSDKILEKLSEAFLSFLVYGRDCATEEGACRAENDCAGWLARGTRKGNGFIFNSAIECAIPGPIESFEMEYAILLAALACFIAFLMVYTIARLFPALYNLGGSDADVAVSPKFEIAQMRAGKVRKI